MSWDGEHEGHCISNNAIFWAGVFVVIAIDLWIILIPLPFIARLKFPLRKKILSGVMFTFGIFVIIVSLYWLQFINRFTLSHNLTVNFVDVSIWSGLELYVGIICACLPNIHHLLRPVYVWLGLMLPSIAKYSHSHSAGGSTGPYHRLNEVKASKEDMIHAVTTIDVQQHQSERE
ncbi:hypothetical protein HD806DRAFT_538478 [Xylariaceae sp. AK1471]|nr:hypothetical protein HD806DRAFT_538478 [Xylariaceae sp. AK1471]